MVGQGPLGGLSRALLPTHPGLEGPEEGPPIFLPIEASGLHVVLCIVSPGRDRKIKRWRTISGGQFVVITNLKGGFPPSIGSFWLHGEHFPQSAPLLQPPSSRPARLGGQFVLRLAPSDTFCRLRCVLDSGVLRKFAFALFATVKPGVFGGLFGASAEENSCLSSIL